MKEYPSKDFLLKNFDYHDGFLVWKIPGIKRRVGKIAGSLGMRGYWIIGLGQKLFFAHRLIWIWHFGPTEMLIDHRNQVKHDNRIQNLRLATKADNCRHVQRVNKKSITGFKGVVYVTTRGIKPFQAQIMVNNKNKYLGTFKTAVEAAKAYNKAALKFHGEFACLNNI